MMATQIGDPTPAETHTLGESVPETTETGLPIDPTRTAETVGSKQGESDPVMSEGDSLQRLSESRRAEEATGCGGSESTSRSGGGEGGLELQTLSEGTSELVRSGNISRQTEEQPHVHPDDCGSQRDAELGTVDNQKLHDEPLPPAGQDLVDASTNAGSEQPSRTVEDVSDVLANVHLDGPSQEVVNEAEPQEVPRSLPAQVPQDAGHREDQLPLSTQSEASSSHAPSQQLQVIREPADSSNQRPVNLGGLATSSPMASLTSSEREARDSHTPGSLSGSTEESELESGRLSPFLLVSKDNITNVSELESPGLLYASGIKEKHNRDLYAPPDEVAQDVLEFSSQVQLDSGARVRVKISPRKDTPDREIDGVERSIGSATERRRHRKSVPIDLGALLQLEIHAKQVAGELSFMMDNLRNSLHAMTACTVQSVELHRESVDSLHQVVDVNVKAMFSFMAKFEELQKNLAPLQEIATQIKEISDALKILERGFKLS